MVGGTVEESLSAGFLCILWYFWILVYLVPLLRDLYSSLFRILAGIPGLLFFLIFFRLYSMHSWTNCFNLFLPCSCLPEFNAKALPAKLVSSNYILVPPLPNALAFIAKPDYDNCSFRGAGREGKREEGGEEARRRRHCWNHLISKENFATKQNPIQKKWSLQHKSSRLGYWLTEAGGTD